MRDVVGNYCGGLFEQGVDSVEAVTAIVEPCVTKENRQGIQSGNFSNGSG